MSGHLEVVREANLAALELGTINLRTSIDHVYTFAVSVSPIALPTAQSRTANMSDEERETKPFKFVTGKPPDRGQDPQDSCSSDLC